jgi:hypothetical protein
MNTLENIPTHKVCTKCKKLTDMNLFVTNKQGKYQKQSWCNLCRSIYYRQNKPRLQHLVREGMLKRVYGIDKQGYENLLNLQNGKCAICGLLEKEHRNKVLNVDHNHVTKKVRGLLCNNCNRGIGHLKDSISNLQKALEYLKERGSYHE